MSWDFDFEQEDSFLDTDFQNTDSMFFSGSPTFEASFIEPQEEEVQTIQYEPAPLTSLTKVQPTSQSHDLAEENDQLRQFFTSLKEKAEQVETINQNLKGQLEECRNWFKTAMFTGIVNHK